MSKSQNVSVNYIRFFVIIFIPIVLPQNKTKDPNN